VTVFCTPCPSGGGRRPAGLRRSRTPRAKNAPAAYLASMGFEEEASVFAFERMTGELAALRAPAVLVRGTTRAASDERRHAKVMTKLATARGGAVAKPRPPGRREGGGSGL